MIQIVNVIDNMAHYDPIKIHNRDEYDAYLRHVKDHPNMHHMYEPEMEWDITTIEDAQNEQIRELFHGNVCILDTFIKYKGQLVCGYPTSPHETYRLDGVQITNEDFYWILSKDNKIKYLTCCAAIKSV